VPKLIPYILLYSTPLSGRLLFRYGCPLPRLSTTVIKHIIMIIFIINKQKVLIVCFMLFLNPGLLIIL